MKRKALIIYCTDTPSGELNGPIYDCKNMTAYLTSCLGGAWESNEIIPLHNPTIGKVRSVIKNEFQDLDYSMVLFSGHGFINTEDGCQYLEMMDGDAIINILKTGAPRQTAIIDACRGYERAISDSTLKMFSAMNESDDSVKKKICRQLFDDRVMEAERGISVLYSASENESSVDTPKGAVYISSLIAACKEWEKNDSLLHVLSIKGAHLRAIDYMNRHFMTDQNPMMAEEKRRRYFPLAIKG